MATLYDAFTLLQQSRFIDLTHTFDDTIPHCASFAPEQRVTLYHYDAGVGVKGQGFLAHEYRLAGQWGTHVDPPSHFIRGGRSLDKIPVEEMLAPLAVIDISARAATDADTQVTLSDLAQWEAQHGPLPAGAFVALYTGWSQRWPNQDAMENRDEQGMMHFPGWSQDVLAFLAHERHVVAIGHDTMDTDRGTVVSEGLAPLETYWLAQGKWQIELLANLDQLPAAGALIVASWPKPRAGSGFPCRCFALVPQ